MTDDAKSSTGEHSKESIADTTSVLRWIEELQRLDKSKPDIAQHITTLVSFCQFTTKAPDEMIAEVIDDDKKKIRFKRRRQYSEAIGEWEQTAGRESGNIVRSFFIHNGLFLATPIRSWR